MIAIVANSDNNVFFNADDGIFNNFHAGGHGDERSAGDDYVPFTILHRYFYFDARATVRAAVLLPDRLQVAVTSSLSPWAAATL